MSTSRMRIFSGSVSRIHLQLCDAVGGTGLYLRALTRGLFQGPPADQTLRTMHAGFTLCTLNLLPPHIQTLTCRSVRIASQHFSIQRYS